MQGGASACRGPYDKHKTTVCPQLNASVHQAVDKERSATAARTRTGSAGLGTTSSGPCVPCCVRPWATCASLWTSRSRDHPIVSRDLNNVAVLLKDMNRFAEAEPLIRRALAIDEQNFGPDDFRLATRLGNLAAVLEATGRFDEAESLLRRALAIGEARCSREHPAIVLYLNNLDTLLMSTGRWKEGESFLRRALAIDENAYGPDHPSVAAGLINLAVLLGPYHPSVARDLNNIATLYRHTDRFVEAEDLMRRALVAFLKSGRSNGYDHPQLKLALERSGTRPRRVAAGPRGIDTALGLRR